MALPAILSVPNDAAPFLTLWTGATVMCISSTFQLLLCIATRAIGAYAVSIGVLAIAGCGSPPDPLTHLNGAVRIRAVHTFDDLLRQPRHRLAGGIYARLGHEPLSSDTYNGVLVYCLTEGGLATVDAARATLGPFTLEVTQDGRRTQRFPMVREPRRPKLLVSPGSCPDSLLFFAQTVVLDSPGTFRCEIIDSSGNPCGFFDGEVTLSQDPSWIPMGFESGQLSWGTKWPDIALGHTEVRLWVRGPGAGESIPYYDGRRGMEIRANTVRGKCLPRLNPGIVDPGLRIEITEEGLRVHSDLEIPISDADYSFIARWWVNGVPFRQKVSNVRELDGSLGNIRDRDGKIVGLAFRRKVQTGRTFVFLEPIPLGSALRWW